MANSPNKMTVKVPIYTRVGRKEIELGTVEVDVQVIAGRPQAPRPRDVVVAVRKGLR